MTAKPFTSKHVDMTIQITIIEDDPTIREGYSYLINNCEGFHITSSYGSFEEAEQHLTSDKPDVILLDIELPGLSGIEAIARIKKMMPDVGILMLTVYENEQVIFKALSNGASGYLTKNTPAAKIIDAISEVFDGGGPMSPGIAKLVIRSFQRSLNSPLSKRETQILENIAEGKSRSKIAKELFIDLETVKTHIKNIYFKLNVNSKEEALRVARHGRFI
jgi:DNA-binding NarL/FixJ family response regulator